MSTWYYYDSNGEKQGPITGGQLKWLAKNGKITPGTLVETENGKAVLAVKVKGLSFVDMTSLQQTNAQIGAMWTVRTGKQNNTEQGTEVLFSSTSDAEWAKIQELAQKYAQIHLRSCPPVTISSSSKKLVFRLGHSASKPVLIAGTDSVSSAECAIYRDQLINGAEVFHQQGLGIGLLDRQLIWKLDGAFLFIPAFWLPAFDNIEVSQTGMPPEYVSASNATISQTGDIYTIAAFCFRALTGREYDPNQPILPGDVRPDLKCWDAVLDHALRKSPARRIASFQEWKAIQPQQTSLAIPKSTLPAVPASQPLSLPVSADISPKTVTVASTSAKSPFRRNVLLTLIAVVLLVIVGRFFAPGLMRAIPVLNTFAPAAYQRGTGSYVVRYTDRSYDRAQWKMVWSTENAEGVGELNSIGGWDKDNLAIGTSHLGSGVVLRDGLWSTHSQRFEKPYYTDASTFYASDGFELLRFTPSGYSVEKDFGYPGVHRVCQLDKDYFQIFVFENDLFESENGVFSKVVIDEKRAWIWNDNNTKTEHLVTSCWRNHQDWCQPLFHSFGSGRALAIFNHHTPMFQYKGGLWYKHYAVDASVVRDMWAIDGENFIFVGSGISRFRDGKEDHPTVNVLDEAFDSRYVAVWGVDMDKFWVLDIKGNVAQFDKNGVRVIVRGPKLDRDDFVAAWISPEGVVYAITEKEVYRLD